MNEFSVNSSTLFILVAIIIIFVIAQSLFFITRAWKRGIELGMEKSVLKKTVIFSAIFTIAPAISILIGIIALSKFLGFPLPWLRLSVIGSITYEFTAATSAALTMGVDTAKTINDPKVFSAIVWVMTLGIIPSLILIPLFGKKITNGILSLKAKDEKWGGIFMDALFLGMISAFLGMIFATISDGLTGWIPVFVMMVSALLMVCCGLLVKKAKIKWLEDFALPISMVGAMILAIPITNLIESLV